jgi:hypothetical protein
MKILKLILGCFAAIIIGFLLIGVIWPSIRYENKIEIDRTAQETFAQFNDSAKMKNWITGLKDLKMVNGNWNDLGSKYQIVVEQEETTYIMYETLTGIVPGKLYAFVLENDVLINEVEIRFAQKNPGTTELVIKNKVRGKNIFWRSLFPFFKGLFKKSDLENYQNLKKMIEGTSTEN